MLLMRYGTANALPHPATPLPQWGTTSTIIGAEYGYISPSPGHTDEVVSEEKFHGAAG